MEKENEDILENFEENYPLECYKNRELSWLEFNARVLEEANDEKFNPLCERLLFLSIFQSNLDEYYMVRAGLLYDQRKMDIRDSKTQMTSKEQLDAVLSETGKLLKKKDKTYKSLIRQLKAYGIEILKYDDLSDKEKRSADRYFLSDVLPFLSPQIVASKQPFPFLNNKEIYSVSLLKKKGDGVCLGIIPCSNPVLQRLIPVNADSKRFILSEELIFHHTSRVFDHYPVLSSSLIRIVRNADISVDDLRTNEDEKERDYRKSMEKMIQRRKKLSPIRLEFTGMIDNGIVNALCRYMKLPRKHAFYSASPLDFGFFKKISTLLSDQKELFYVPRSAQRSPMVSADERVMDTVRKRDILLSFPYESIRPFLRLLNEAASDPEVVSIKMTLYRVAQSSQIVDSLIQAAENGKDVLVMMELRARFDEENNVLHSKDLENAGCRLIYGLDNFKVHSKLCLITKKHGEEIEYITQIGTGNYNENTAKLYTDYSLITAERSIGEEAAAVFNSLSLGEPVEHTDTLLVAPKCLQEPICSRIDKQILLARQGKPAYIGLKLNSLSDKVIIDKLIEASIAGVKVQLLVRGICCLVTGVAGYTENIEVYSIVGRYLEHSRIYIFGCDGNEEVFISSADMMTRNTIHRVEVAVPILDPAIQSFILSDFQKLLSDNVKLRIMQDDGCYRYIDSGAAEPFCAQEYFAEGGFRSESAFLSKTDSAPDLLKPMDSGIPAEELSPVSYSSQSEKPETDPAPRTVLPETQPAAASAAFGSRRTSGFRSAANSIVKSVLHDIHRRRKH